MTSWQDRFDKHAVWTTLEELRSVIDGTALPENDADRDTVEFVRTVAERVRSYKTDADPISFTPQILADGEAAVRVVLNAYKAWQAEDTDYKPVDTAVDGLIVALAKWPAPTPGQLGRSASAAVEAMSAAAAEAIDKLLSKTDDLSSKIDKAGEHHADLVQDQGLIEKRLTTAMDEQQSIWTEVLAQKKTEADTRLRQIAALRDEARNMVHEATSLMVGAEYLEYAKEKKHQAWAYDSLAVVFGSVGLVTLYLYIESGVDTDASIAQAVTRLGITIGALIISGFLAKRGGDQHRESREARRTALALSRMAPFIANLDPDAQELLTIETADRIFTRGELGPTADRDSVLSKVKALRKERAESTDGQ